MCVRLSVYNLGDGDIKQHVVKKVHTLTDFQLFMNRFSPDGLGLPRTLMTLFRAPVDGDYVTQTIPSVYLHMDRYEAKDLVDNFKESSIVRFSERNPECFVWYSKQRGSELIRKFSNGTYFTIAV